MASPEGLVNAVSVLIIACPCALGLATPMAVVVGMGRGAAMGVLFRNAETLEQFRRIDTLVFDKTGTLTIGKPELATVEPAEGQSADELLRLAASLERGSEHPLASAIVNAAELEAALAARGEPRTSSSRLAKAPAVRSAATTSSSAARLSWMRRKSRAKRRAGVSKICVKRAIRSCKPRFRACMPA